MRWASIQDMAEQRVLHLTTIGRRTGLPREIEIWFVVCRDRFYRLAEKGEAAGWVKNIRRIPRAGESRIEATVRVLDCQADTRLWEGSGGNRDSQIRLGRRAASGVNADFAPLFILTRTRPSYVAHRRSRGTRRAVLYS